MKEHRIAVIPGDGIGREVIPEGVRVLEAVGARHGIKFAWKEFPWSCDWYKAHGKMCPADAADMLGKCDTARRLKRDKGMSVLIVDYLQLITARGRFGNRQEEVASISRGLKGLAKELRIPVLVLSQLTRAPERDERGPQLSDLRESGAIEQDADVVMFIYRPHFFKAGATPEEREETELRIAKQRNGPTDMVKFVFRSRFTRFEEAAPDAFSSLAPDEM